MSDFSKKVDPVYLGSTGTDTVVKPVGGDMLFGLVIGNALATVTLADHASSASTNTLIKLTTPSTGYYPLNTKIRNGVTVTLSGAADVTLLFGA